MFTTVTGGSARPANRAGAPFFDLRLFGRENDLLRVVCVGRNGTGRFSFNLDADEMFAPSITRELQSRGGAGLRDRPRDANSSGCFAVTLNQNHAVIGALDVIVTRGKTLPRSNEVKWYVNVKGVGR